MERQDANTWSVLDSLVTTRGVPAYRAAGWPIRRVLTDQGSEYRGAFEPVGPGVPRSGATVADPPGGRGLIVAALALSPLYSLLRPLSFLPRARTYAERWDARDRQIREAVRLGAKTLTVLALDTIAGLNDVAPDPPRNWVNRCIADY